MRTRITETVSETDTDERKRNAGTLGNKSPRRQTNLVGLSLTGQLAETSDLKFAINDRYKCDLR